MKIDICVISYRRPIALQRLLVAFQHLRLPEPATELRVVIVDNDPGESARSVCEDAASWLRHDVLYLVEKRRGIPQARNTALAAALDRADYLAFIDDDEVPDGEWLSELMRIRASSDADAVAGPCRPVFERPPPRWIESSGLFEHPRHVSGARIGYAYTNNVLISTRALAQMDAFFDERMALIGSSDTEFFERFACGGRRVVWCDTAVVREWVSPSRATFGWLMRRALRVGTAGTFIDRQCREQPVCICQIALHGGWCLAKGLALAAFGMLRGRGAAARGLSLGSYGAGRLLGLTGWAYEEYRTTHGA